MRKLITYGSAQVWITSQVKLKGNRLMDIRQSTEPEQKMQEMFSVLGIKHQQKTKIKFVGPPKHAQKIDLLIFKELPEGFAQYGLNSISLINASYHILCGYKEIDLYLDADKPGREASSKLMRQHPNARDKNTLYSDIPNCKDLNQWYIFYLQNTGR